MAGIPTHPDEIDAAWLTERLRAVGVIDDQTVTGFTWVPIGTGQVGDSARLTLKYDRPGKGPATLAGKFPAADATSRQTAGALGLYAKEVGFYRELCRQAAVRVPVAHVAEVDEGGADFILIFEDLGPARGGNQLASCSAADARAGVSQAAALHAPTWENPQVVDLPWLVTPQAVVDHIRAAYDGAQAIFRDRYKDQLEPEFMRLCDELNDMRELWYGREPGARCLIHGDFRLDNMLFDIHGGAEEIAVLDWQTAGVGNGLTDIGYFLGTGIGDELRRAHEDELLDLYCAEMTRRGVAMTRDSIWDQYVIGALHGVSTAVFSAAFVERTARGDENFLSMARGGCALALQHGSLSKLKG